MCAVPRGRGAEVVGQAAAAGVGMAWALVNDAGHVAAARVVLVLQQAGCRRQLVAERAGAGQVRRERRQGRVGVCAGRREAVQALPGTDRDLREAMVPPRLCGRGQAETMQAQGLLMAACAGVVGHAAGACGTAWVAVLSMPIPRSPTMSPTRKHTFCRDLRDLRKL